MVNAAGAAAARTPLGADLAEGVKAVSYDQELTFTRYVRKVLPLDGYVFWIRGDLVSPPNAKVITVKGSFHYTTDRQQDEAETFALNKVVFTSLGPVDDFADINPNTMYIANYDGLDFAFSTRGMFYNQAQIWHYRGNAIYPDMQSQIINSTPDLPDPSNRIVSNSLPVWLSLNTFTPDWPFYPSLPLTLTLYPSFLTPQNITPPWGTVDIGEDDTQPIASAPGFGPTQDQSQLSYDHVRVTLWGADNDIAMNFIATINQFSVDTGLFGIMSRPIIRDGKRTQTELMTIAQRKVIEYDVSYLQQNIVNFARQLIEHVVPTFIPN